MATTINYVKFLRGTPAAFEKLSIKDKDTLYFISEPGAKNGLLYLGDKIIAGSSSTGSISNLSIADLKDVIIDNTGLTDGSILMYDWVKKVWVNKTLDEVVVDVMQGASSTKAGAAGLVPAPKVGEQNKFLRGDGTWAEAGLTDAEKQELQDNTSKLEALIGDSTKLDGTVPSISEIALETLTEALVPEDAKESLDTLQEISDWIQKHPGDVSAINSNILDLQASVGSIENVLNGTKETEGLVSTVGKVYDSIFDSDVGLDHRVANIEDVLYDSVDENGDTIQGLISIVGNLQNPEGSYVLQSVYRSEVGSISSLNFTDENSTTIVDEINSINSRLKWVDLDEEI